MINHLVIKGFKRFDDEGIDIPLAPLTLLLGGNSSGKSSIFQSLLCIEQSWERLTGISDLATAGSRVDLGRFSSVLHKSESSISSCVKIEIDGVTFEWFDDIASANEPDYRSTTRHGTLDSITVNLKSTGLPLAEQHSPSLECRELNVKFNSFLDIMDEKLHLTLDQKTIKYWINNNKQDEELLTPLIKTKNDDKETGSITWILDDEFGALEFPQCEPQSNEGIIPIESAIQNNPRNGDTLWGVANHAIERILAIRRQLRKLTHIGGLRERGARIYETLNADSPWQVGISGQRIADVLFSSEGGLIRTNELLTKTGIPYNIAIRNIDGPSDSVEILLRDMRDGPTAGNEIGIPDVGSGVAQILPIAVQLAALASSPRIANDTIVLIEQPELHLHPAWQARLARMFTEAIDPSFCENRIQIFVETHSEHLILALGNEIANKSRNIHPNEISLLVFEDEPYDGCSYVERVHFDDDGKFLDRWPGGFFPERRQLLERGEF